MGVVRRIHHRGATVTVEAHGEVLFMPGGSVNTWANRFTGRIRARTIAAAPTNKRPRWAHYGKPLKGTIVSARPRFWGNGRDRQRVYAAVGSTAPHALYVDQGTGIYGGSGPYEAKILPPWSYGSPSLYERTWRPGGPGTKRVAPVMIKGQKGQHFFDKGLADAFRSMRMRSAQLPGEGTPRITDVLASTPSVVQNFLGNTAATPAFVGQLNEWRSWRDKAWENGGRLGDDDSAPPPKRSRAVSPKPPKLPKPPKPDTSGYPNLRAKQDAAVQAFRRQNPNVTIQARTTAGLVVISPVDGRRYVIPWSRIYPLI